MAFILKQTLKGSDFMADLVLQSSLTMDEIEENFKDVDFFSGIMEGLQEVLDYEKGTAAVAMSAREKKPK